MNNICGFCVHQTQDREGRLYCNKSPTSISEYGLSIYGAKCIHDQTLKDLFDSGEKDKFALSSLQQINNWRQQLDREQEEHRKTKRAMNIIIEGLKK